MAYKLVKKSSNGASAFFQEEGQEKGKWYFYDKRVQPFAVKLREGQMVTFRTELKDGKDHIMFLQVEGAGQGGGGAKTTFSKPGGYRQPWKPNGSYGKDKETQDSIIKQTVMKAASEIVASRTYANVEAALVDFDIIYAHLHEKVKSASTATAAPAQEPVGAIEVYDESDPNQEPA